MSTSTSFSVSAFIICSNLLLSRELARQPKLGALLERIKQLKGTHFEGKEGASAGVVGVCETKRLHRHLLLYIMGIGSGSANSGTHRSGWGKIVDDFDDLVKGLDDKVDVAGSLAHLSAESELLREEVEGGNEETHEGAGGSKELVGVLHGFAEVSWEHGSEGGHRKGDGDQSDLKELLSGEHVAVHGAVEVGVGCWWH